MTFLIFDGVILVVLLLFAGLGWHRGLLLSLCGLAVAVASLLGAGFLADTLDGPVADAIVPRLAQTIETRLTAKGGETSDNAVGLLREEDGVFPWAADAVEKALEEQEILPNISDISNAAAQFLAQRMANMVLFALAFLLLYVLLTLVLHALDLVAKLPGLKFCNHLGGGVIGLLKGAIVVFVAVAALMSSTFRPDAEVLSSSYLLRFFTAFNPILALLAG